MEKVNLSSVRNSTADEQEWNFLLSSYWLVEWKDLAPSRNLLTTRWRAEWSGRDLSVTSAVA